MINISNVAQSYKNFSKPRNRRRRLASEEGVLFDLKDELPILFETFKEAVELYEREISFTPPTARVRGFEASTLNSKMVQCIQKRFPHSWMFGKYRRFILRIKGYLILFKKLDNKNMPMNIRTKLVSSISQQLSLPLFDGSSSVEEPILFFGYRRNKVGQISDPKLVYIDDDKLEWVISSENVSQKEHIHVPRKVAAAVPILRENKGKSGKTA